MFFSGLKILILKKAELQGPTSKHAVLYLPLIKSISNSQPDAGIQQSLVVIFFLKREEGKLIQVGR